jgi:hypothetical protein
VKRFLNWLLKKKRPTTDGLPDPFDADLEGAYLDGPSALAAEKPARYYKHPYNSEEWKKAYERQKKRNENAILPPTRKRVTLEEDADQKQYWTWEAAKRGVPMHEWMEGRDFSQTSGYVTTGYVWEGAPPLAEHYTPGLSKFRKSKTEEWRGMTKDSWFNYYTKIDQPLGSHLQVVQDNSTKITYRYCQKGHLHEYHNGVLVSKNGYGKKKKSKHLEIQEAHPYDWSKSYGNPDKTIVESPECD